MKGGSHAQEGGEYAQTSQKESPCVWDNGSKPVVWHRVLGLNSTEPHGFSEVSENSKNGGKLLEGLRMGIV